MNEHMKEKFEMFRNGEITITELFAAGFFHAPEEKRLEFRKIQWQYGDAANEVEQTAASQLEKLLSK